MRTGNATRTEGAVLIGRKDGEYWFVDSVFQHNDNFAGCTGTIVVPISVAQAEEMLSVEYLQDRYEDVWHESANSDIKYNCDPCTEGPNEAGCDYCGYQSFSDFCSDIAQYEGLDAVTDFPGHDFEAAILELLGDEKDTDPRDRLETVDCTGCGRIFGEPLAESDFDKVYNHKALTVILAFEDGAVTYDYARHVIFGA